MIGAVVMLSGIGFLTVITAAVTAALIESGRRRAGGISDRDLSAQLDEISARLAAIEAGAGPSPQPPEGPAGQP